MMQQRPNVHVPGQDTNVLVGQGQDTNVRFVQGQDTNVRVVYVSNPPLQTAASTGCCGQRRPNLKASAVTGLSIVQIILGFIAVVANTIDLSIGCNGIFIMYTGYGIYCGAIFILSGCFGLAAGQTRLTGWIITLMVFSIISVVFTSYMLSCAAVELEEASGDVYYCDSECDYPPDNDCPQQKVSLSLASIQLVCAVAELIVAVITSVLCCSGINCCCRTRSVQDQSSNSPVSYIQPGPVGREPMSAPFVPGTMTSQVSPGYYVQNPTGYSNHACTGTSSLPPQYSETQRQHLHDVNNIREKY